MAHSANTEVASPDVTPAKNADWVYTHYARLWSSYDAQDQPFLKTSPISVGKERDNMIKINYMSTLFVGIDVSFKSNVVCAMDFDEKANSIRRHIPEYRDFYEKKYAEVTKHKHKRALVLTSRKFVRLVFGLLAKNQLYTGEKLDTELNIDSN